MSEHKSIQLHGGATIAELLSTMLSQGLGEAHFEIEESAALGRPPCMVVAVMGAEVERLRAVLKAHTPYFKPAASNGDSHIITLN